MSTTTWALDPSHSELQFKVKHLMITTVTGSFTDFTVSATSEGEDFTKSSISFSAKTGSVNTNSEQRDGHLKSPDFFDAEKYPEISFKSTAFEATSEANEFKLKGDLTIKDVTKPVVLNVEFGGVNKDPWGNLKAGFTLSGKINRNDWGLNWNAALETGGVLVSEDVRLLAEIQLVKA